MSRKYKEKHYLYTLGIIFQSENSKKHNYIVCHTDNITQNMWIEKKSGLYLDYKKFKRRVKRVNDLNEIILNSRNDNRLISIYCNSIIDALKRGEIKNGN